MIKIKTKEEIEILREGGRRNATILKSLADMVHPGLAVKDIELKAKNLISESGDMAAFLNYTPYGAMRPYPASVCVSVNDQIVHGIPNESEYILKEGDIVSLDLGLKHKGLYTDHAVTVPVGKIEEKYKNLLKFTEQALIMGIDVAKPGKRIGLIGFTIESFAKKHGYGVVEELSGHGVGYSVHEEPYVPNHGTANKGPILKVGMVLAIEPMFNMGTKKIVLDKDGYTYRTADGKYSAHFEHTVVITENGAEILTSI